MNNKQVGVKRLYACDQPHDKWYEHIMGLYAPKTHHDSKHMFDSASLSHIFFSLLATYISRKIFGQKMFVPITVFLVSTGFEVYENLPDQINEYYQVELENSKVSTYTGDSIINVIGDIMSNILGIYIGYTCSDAVILVVLALLLILITITNGREFWAEAFGFLFK